MARGFWTGLLHGGVIGVAGLAVLSLMAPLPQPASEQAESVAETAPALQPAPASVPAPMPAPAVTVSPAPYDGPRAGAVDLPVGSEFGKGGDIAPVLPAPLAQDRPNEPEAPAVVAPTSEPAPVAVTAADPQPQPLDGASGPIQTPPAEAEDAPPADQPAFPSRPALPDAPVRAVADVPDAAPAVTLDLPASRSDNAVPGLASPAIDLSLPPDLSELQGQPDD